MSDYLFIIDNELIRIDSLCSMENVQESNEPSPVNDEPIVENVDTFQAQFSPKSLQNKLALGMFVCQLLPLVTFSHQILP